MLVYDVTNEKSFDNIRNWIRNIEEVSPVRSLNCLPKMNDKFFIGYCKKIITIVNLIIHGIENTNNC